MQTTYRTDATMNAILRPDTYVTELLPQVPKELLHFGLPATWSHIASTLIVGDKEAVYVDQPIDGQARK